MTRERLEGLLSTHSGRSAMAETDQSQMAPHNVFSDQSLMHNMFVNRLKISNQMEIPTSYGLVAIVNEPTYSFNSADNARPYTLDIILSSERITSIHGVRLNGDGILAVGAGGGCTSVHKNSALALGDKLYLAVGDHVACFSLEPPFRKLWSIQADSATCFGIHLQNERGALYSHGELAITRISPDGSIIWQVYGADIFSEEFRLMPGYIEAIDFNKSVYRFDYMTGELLHC